MYLVYKKTCHENTASDCEAKRYLRNFSTIMRTRELVDIKRTSKHFESMLPVQYVGKLMTSAMTLHHARSSGNVSS